MTNNELLQDQEIHQLRQALEMMVELFEPTPSGGWSIDVPDTGAANGLLSCIGQGLELLPFEVDPETSEIIDLAREILYGGEGVPEEC